MNEKTVLYFSKKKARNKIYWLIFYVLIMLIAAIFISEGNINKGIISFIFVFVIMSLPQLVIHFNYLKHDKNKRVIFDYKNDIFQEFIDGKLKTEIKINDIKKITHFRGSADDYSNRLPHTNYHYYKMYTQNKVVVFSHFLTNEEFVLLPKLDNVKISFFNLMNLKNDYKIEQSKVIKESNDIEYYTNSRILKFIDQYGSKTDKELHYIIKNKKMYQVEAVKAAQFILKGRKN